MYKQHNQLNLSGFITPITGLLRGISYFRITIGSIGHSIVPIGNVLFIQEQKQSYPISIYLFLNSEIQFLQVLVFILQSTQSQSFSLMIYTLVQWEKAHEKPLMRIPCTYLETRTPPPTRAMQASFLPSLQNSVRDQISTQM